MKKEYRVRKNEEFQSIIKKKRSVANGQFVIYYSKNDSHLRVGISVSKKLGNAVVRNKVKRQVRMMVSQTFEKNQNKDYIIIVRNKYLLGSYEDNKRSLEYLYNKINRRKD